MASSLKGNIPDDTYQPTLMSFNKIINYLKNLQQIGKGNPNTTDNIPNLNDIQNIANSGKIKNQMFIDSLCKLLRLKPAPQITANI